MSKSLTVADSAFYTFTIEGEYRWTVSREELAEHDWSILVDFDESDDTT